MANAKLKPTDKTCTTLEERPEYALLPPGKSKGYLAEKARHAMKFPRTIWVRIKKGDIVPRLMMQLITSAQIRADERLHNYFWQYKAEVSFDMAPTKEKGGVPKPFLSSGKQNNVAGQPKDSSRRHSLNPFPPERTRGKGFVRRPDVIIVKDEKTRWPGLETTDHEGHPHPDNLLRVVELKFPNDILSKEQRDAYELIAGGNRARLCIVDVNDCDGDIEKARQLLPATAPAGVEIRDEDEVEDGLAGERERADIRSLIPIAEPAFFEYWLNDAKQISHALWDDMCIGVSQLSQEAQTWLKDKAPWLFTAGRWVHDTSAQVYRWVSDKGTVIATWTQRELRQAWQEIAEATDLVWEQLKLISWSQLLIDTVQGVCVIGIMVAGVMISIALSPYLAAALTALVGISTLSVA